MLDSLLGITWITLDNFGQKCCNENVLFYVG